MKIRDAVQSELERTGGLLRLAPCWVPRLFPKPGMRLRLDPRDLYAFGRDRGAITERWLASTVRPMNEHRGRDEGLSYVVVAKSRFLLKQVIDELGADIIGRRIWDKYGMFGLGLAAPMTVGAQIGAGFGIALNAVPRRLFVVMTLGALAWSIGLTIACLVGLLGLQTVAT